jgi:hypothetical protein
MFVTKLGHYPIVLGIPWMNLHDVAIRFSSRSLTFGSQYCMAHCNKSPTTVTALSEEPPEPPPPKNHLATAAAKLNISSLSSRSFGRLAKKERLTICSLSLYEINRAIESSNDQNPDLPVLVPKEYHPYLPLFRESVASQLPPHRPYDH